MKTPLLLTLATALMLSACGRQETVDELPSTSDLANAAKAEADKAVKKAGVEEEQAAENRNYLNPVRGFSITLPEGWSRDAGASNADGVVAQDPGAGADVRVFWQKNDGDKDLHQIVAAMNGRSEAVDGDFVGENEYRGTANDGEGNNVAVRLVKKADGSLVSATFVFPEMLNEQYLAIAQKTLDSLRVFAPAVPDAAAPSPASNAAQ